MFNDKNAEIVFHPAAMTDGDYIDALEAENRAFRKEVEFIKQIKVLVLRLVEARRTREHCSSVRHLISVQRENKRLKRELAEVRNG